MRNNIIMVSLMLFCIILYPVLAITFPFYQNILITLFQMVDPELKFYVDAIGLEIIYILLLLLILVIAIIIYNTTSKTNILKTYNKIELPLFNKILTLLISLLIVMNRIIYTKQVSLSYYIGEDINKAILATKLIMLLMVFCMMFVSVLLVKLLDKILPKKLYFISGIILGIILFGIGFIYLKHMIALFFLIYGLYISMVYKLTNNRFCMVYILVCLMVLL